MLVLTRRKNESITITDPASGEEIVVTLTRIGGQTVRLGIEAPRHWGIARTELLALEAEAAERVARETPALAAS